MHCFCLFFWSRDDILLGLFFSNEVACAAPKTVIHFLEQGSYSVCVALGYTVGVGWGYHKTNKKNVFKKTAEVSSSLSGN